jgi:hypothetical protein
MAAAQLGSRVIFVDFDDPFLFSNNPSEEPRLVNGCIQLNAIAGNGAIPVE